MHCARLSLTAEVDVNCFKFEKLFDWWALVTKISVNNLNSKMDYGQGLEQKRGSKKWKYLFKINFLSKSRQRTVNFKETKKMFTIFDPKALAWLQLEINIIHLISFIFFWKEEGILRVKKKKKKKKKKKVELWKLIQLSCSSFFCLLQNMITFWHQCFFFVVQCIEKNRYQCN